MMDEEDQHAHAGDGKHNAPRDRDVGHEQRLFHAADHAQHQQAVQKGGDKRTEHELVGTVSQKPAQQARAELRTRKRQNGTRDGEGRTGDRDHGAGHGGKERTRSLRAAGEYPPQAAQAFGIHVLVQHDQPNRERGAACQHERRMNQ
jgi:hypothetical protein